MKNTTRTALLGIGTSLVLGTVVAFAGASGSAEVGSLPVFVLCAIIAFALNYVAFVPSYLARTEHYYDLTGSLTYLSLVVVGLALSSNLDTRAWVVAALVVVWALRLGSFLFGRVKRDGGDGRFDAIKLDPLRFLMMWSVQALWVLLTLAAGLAAITAEDREPFGVLGVVGLIVWIIGFALEVMADRQKRVFRADPANAGRFITTGLWAWSRHPNYFGEIVLWSGVAIIALPVLSGWRWLLLISPVFVYLLLTRFSGVPMLESRAKKRWGDEPEFRAYKKHTPVLVPRPPRPQ